MQIRKSNSNEMQKFIIDLVISSGGVYFGIDVQCLRICTVLANLENPRDQKEVALMPLSTSS